MGRGENSSSICGKILTCLKYWFSNFVYLSLIYKSMLLVFGWARVFRCSLHQLSVEKSTVQFAGAGYSETFHLAKSRQLQHLCAGTDERGTITFFTFSSAGTRDRSVHPDLVSSVLYRAFIPKAKQQVKYLPLQLQSKCTCVSRRHWNENQLPRATDGTWKGVKRSPHWKRGRCSIEDLIGHRP